MTEPDIAFSVAITGDTGVGKTSLLHYISKGSFLEKTNPTIAGDITQKTVKIGYKNVQLVIWDTSGVKEYKSMNYSHYADAQAIIYLYSLDNPTSLDNILTQWHKEVENNSEVPHLNFLVGNQLDIANQEAIETSEAESLIQKQLSAPNIIKISVKNGCGVKDMLKCIATELLKDYNKRMEDQEKRNMSKKEKISKKLIKTEGGCCRIC